MLPVFYSRIFPSASTLPYPIFVLFCFFHWKFEKRHKKAIISPQLCIVLSGFVWQTLTHCFYYALQLLFCRINTGCLFLSHFAFVVMYKVLYLKNVTLGYILVQGIEITTSPVGKKQMQGRSCVSQNTITVHVFIFAMCRNYIEECKI